MRERGFALPITLWVMVLLTIIALHFSMSARWGTAGTRNFKEDTIAYYAAVSAYEDAIAYLAGDLEPDFDFVDGEGAFRTDDEREPMPSSIEFGGAQVELSISDEESRLNINTLNSARMKALLEAAGMSDEAINIISDSLADWKDSNDLHHLMGAEDSYYGDFGYTAKDAPLDVPGEFLLVKGVGPGVFYGSEEALPLEPLVTTWGEGVNVNTASEEVLKILGFTPTDIDAIMKQRETGHPYKKLGSRFSTGGVTVSRNFRIEVLARVGETPQAVRITAVVNRNFGSQGAEIKTLYWKEDIESSGT